jgi:hypothetical protein
MKKGYYQADTINGVSFYDTTMDLDVEILSADDFYSALGSVEEGQAIYGFFDDFGTYDMDILKKIADEYGIN